MCPFHYITLFSVHQIWEEGNEHEKELFNKVKACYDEMIQIIECKTFMKGFKLGAGFFVECFENDADIFDE